MATTSIAESTISATIREELLPSIYELGSVKDPVYAMAMRSWTDVERNKGIGREYYVKKVWGLGMAGSGSFGSPLGSDMQTDSSWNFGALGTPETWPKYDEVAVPTFLTSQVQLVKHKLNMFIPSDIMQSDQFMSSIGAVTPFYIRGLSRLALMQELGAFYSTAPTTVALGGIGNTSSTVTNVSGDTSAVNIDLSGETTQITRFEKGLPIDLYDSTGTTKRNTNFLLFVDNVDREAQVLRVRRLDGEFQTTTVLGGGVTYAGAGGDDDIIVLRDSIGYTPGTMAAWAADGTDITDFFGIDVTDHGDFKSIKRDIGDAPLTEGILNARVGYFKKTFPEVMLKAAITTEGVLLGFIDNLDSLVQGGSEASTVGVYNPRFRYERQGKAVDIEAGWSKFNYKYGGRSLAIHTSPNMEKGRFMAGPFDLTRFVPPDVPGTTSDGRIGDELQFRASLGSSAYDSIFTRYDHDGAFSNLLQCPCERKSVIMPHTPNYLLLTSIAEVAGFDGT